MDGLDLFSVFDGTDASTEVTETVNTTKRLRSPSHDVSMTMEATPAKKAKIDDEAVEVRVVESINMHCDY